MIIHINLNLGHENPKWLDHASKLFADCAKAARRNRNSLHPHTRNAKQKMRLQRGGAKDGNKPEEFHSKNLQIASTGTNSDMKNIT
jgi:hypothetical protein